METSNTVMWSHDILDVDSYWKFKNDFKSCAVKFYHEQPP